MGKPTGFIEHERRGAEKRAIAERIRDSRELVLPLAPEDAREQAGRCMDCGVPMCHQGCPLGNVIPDFNELVHRDRWREAYEVLASTNDFPEWTGRLCPAPCEASCILSIEPRREPLLTLRTGASHAVAIELVEKTIIERAFAEGWVTPERGTPTGNRIAVVGSGPAGLAAAARLCAAGHDVTVFERADQIGGLLRYGIPDFKLDKAILDRRLAVMRESGVTFRTSVEVGVSPTWSALRAEYDAILIATGAELARPLGLEGDDREGVVRAMDYLEAQNRAIATHSPSPIDARDRRVLVLGGGDTGSDCLGTALRQGARSVMQVEIVPAPASTRAGNNPWPQWPIVMRTSSSQEEGGERRFGRRTTRLERDGDRLVALHWIEVTLENGRLVDVAGTEERIEVDLLVLALGFTGPLTTSLVDQLGVALDRGRVAIDDTRQTSVPGVYCAGDASRGASLIVWAISDGREAARHLDAALMGKPRLPTRGIDQPFTAR